jgi:hypothetical protein
VDLIGPDLQAFLPPDARGAHQSSSTGQRKGCDSAHAAHEICPQLCKVCRQGSRSISVRLHACRYEAAALACMHEPDIVCMFHPGLAAEQPQTVEGAQRGASKQALSSAATRASGGSKQHVKSGRVAKRRAPAASTRLITEQRGPQVDTSDVLHSQLVPRSLDPCIPSDAVELRASEAAMPSLRLAWVASYPQFASLTCPLLVTAFSMGGAPMQTYATLSVLQHLAFCWWQQQEPQRLFMCECSFVKAGGHFVMAPSFCRSISSDALDLLVTSYASR